MMVLATLLRRIDRFCVKRRMSASRFGRDAVNDGSLVADLRAGSRQPTLRTIERIEKFLRDNERKRTQR
jgi:hypothetical protein